MPEEATKRLPSPLLSSDSSLSSAPEIAEFSVGDTTPNLNVGRVRAVDVSNSKKRGRAKEAKEAKEASVPAKRIRREIGRKSIYREATEEGKEPKKATEAPGGTGGKTERKGKAEANGISPTAVHNKTEEAVEVASKVSTKRTKKSKKAKVETVKEEELSPDSPKKIRRRTKVTAEVQEEEQGLGLDTPKKSRKGTKAKLEVPEEEDPLGEIPKKVKRKRKTKEEKEAEAMPLAARTASLKVYIGAHVSSAKGVQNSVTNCVHIGGNAFALFLKSQRKWENPPLQEEHRDQFRAFCEEHKYNAASHILPHGSYLVNLAQEDPDKAKQAYDTFLDDLQRCEALGIKLYNFHPGWTGPSPRPSAITRIATALNRAHTATSTVTPLLENMAGKGTVIGNRFEDLRDIIAQVDDKSRIGVCLDTCHTFAAGYDLRTPQAFKATLEEFDRVVGMKFLRALHLNDSKAPFGSHRDLHQNIGLGFLGLRAFHNVMNEARFEGLPMVLETPIEVKNAEGKAVEDKGIWAREIKLLEGLVGMDVGSEDFGVLERDLAGMGQEERKKYQEAFERKVEKDRKAEEKRKSGKGKRKKKEEEEKGEETEESTRSESD